ncbi:MAG: SDR family oxidoreductase [Defluviitaleaceae bacterium]|nr:SDR family oxidoreductase [Defluviitaleaceae bacterium]
MKRTVLITGSSRGIGLAIAQSFNQNDKVVLNCRRDKAQLKKAMAELDCDGYIADVSSYEECQKMLAKIGEIDVLINNAGASYFGTFDQMSRAEISENLNTNLLSAINLTHLAIPSMIRKKSGCVINISSVWGITGASCEVVYSAAKAGLNGLTRALAKELAPSGIRVNAIACGAFETRMNERLSAQEKNAFAEEIPLGRFGNPQEAGDLAVFLASEKAEYITGQIIALDGGFL